MPHARFRIGDLVQIRQQCGAFKHDLGSGFLDPRRELYHGDIIVIISDAYRRLHHETVYKAFHPTLGTCVLRFYDDSEAWQHMRCV